MAEEDGREARLQRALDDPMPPDLVRLVADYIEPQTINAGIKHGEVMTCIRVAYPVIRDYLSGGTP